MFNTMVQIENTNFIFHGELVIKSVLIWWVVHMFSSLCCIMNIIKVMVSMGGWIMSYAHRWPSGIVIDWTIDKLTWHREALPLMSRITQRDELSNQLFILQWSTLQTGTDLNVTYWRLHGYILRRFIQITGFLLFYEFYTIPHERMKSRLRGYVNLFKHINFTQWFKLRTHKLHISCIWWISY